MSRLKQSWLLGLIVATAAIATTFEGGSLLAQSKVPAQSVAQTQRQRTRLPEGDEKKKTNRLREGTHITDAKGFFQQDGDGASFVSENNITFGGLPNLNLERVIHMLKGREEPENIKWSVSGTVTEFNGRNYLLISRAAYKSISLPPAPDRISE